MIDEISGILDHLPLCKELLEMDWNASIPLHPDLKAFALLLLRDNIPLTQLQQMCKQWACQHWDDKQVLRLLSIHHEDEVQEALCRFVSTAQGEVKFRT
jgi:hypothetical protein